MEKNKGKSWMFLILANLESIDVAEERRKYFKFLREEQKEYIDRFLRQRDRDLCFLVRLLAAEGLERSIGWQKKRTLSLLAHDCAGCPHLLDEEWNLSFSHSFPWAACLVGKASLTGRIGVDIEKIQPHDWDFLSQVCSDEELCLFHEMGLCHELATSIWTSKEAILKLHGTGFYTDPKAVCLTRTPILRRYAQMVLLNVVGIRDFSLSVASEKDVPLEVLAPVSCTGIGVETKLFGKRPPSVSYRARGSMSSDMAHC